MVVFVDTLSGLCYYKKGKLKIFLQTQNEAEVHMWWGSQFEFFYRVFTSAVQRRRKELGGIH